MLIAGCILAALAVGALIYLAVRLTISYLKKYRKKKNSKILAGCVKDIVKNAPHMNLDDLPDDDDIIIAEYDEEEDELVQDLTISKDNDEKVKETLRKNGGIVVFE